MVVGTLSIKLMTRDARSLKDKRRIIKSLKDRTRNNFNVSVSEIGAQDSKQHCVLGIAMVGTDRRHVNGVLSTIINSLRTFPSAELIDYELEFI
ncbi:MAG TPA: DUF503 domain-containing protein [Candidatus Brocadiia bacterium]|nr:DUF503 domain-containing protein [Planctomycetota bacterium]MBI4007321.1 DUF503 domain-containing protein [Planctomycetota bacterium]MDO8092699.1 DUF503 domain-containing protein [Candidatus Brocadiales bacterium]